MPRKELAVSSERSKPAFQTKTSPSPHRKQVSEESGCHPKMITASWQPRTCFTTRWLPFRDTQGGTRVPQKSRMTSASCKGSQRVETFVEHVFLPAYRGK